MGLGVRIQCGGSSVNVNVREMASALDVPDSIEEASLRFREFLRRQGWPDQVQWLATGTALYSKKGYYWIKARKVEESMALARETYQQGVTRGLGIGLEALCNSGAVTYAYVFVPADRDEAERLLMLPLKLSVPLNPHPARVVKSSFLWWILHRLRKLPFDTFPTR